MNKNIFCTTNGFGAQRPKNLHSNSSMAINHLFGSIVMNYFNQILKFIDLIELIDLLVWSD